MTLCSLLRKFHSARSYDTVWQSRKLLKKSAVMTDGLLLYTLHVITTGCLEERLLTSVRGLGLGVVA
jgi:hypothetical protein